MSDINIELITGRSGTPHIASEDVGAFNASIWSNDEYVLPEGLKLNYEIIDNNTIRIYDGDGVMQGRHFRIPSNTYKDVSIENGTVSMKRNDLIVARYVKNNDTAVEECILHVIKGTAGSTAVDPEYTHGDIVYDGDLINEMPLYRVSLDGSNISSVTQLFTIVSKSIYESIIELDANKKTINDNLKHAYNSIPRYKDITKYVNDGTIWDRIAGNNGFKPYEDIFVGDYIKMSRAITCPSSYDSTTGSQYVTVASCGGMSGNGDTAFTKNHLVMVPGKGLEGEQHFGRQAMNSSHTTSGGYKGSNMHNSILGAVVSSGSTSSNATINQQLYAEFGSHLQTTRELLSNAMNSSLTNRFGSSGGASSGWEWVSCQAVLMSEVEVYGSVVWSSSGYDTGNACHQLELFKLHKNAVNNRSAYYWLKDVASASYFCNVSDVGRATSAGAGDSYVYVRPRFILA